MTVSLPAANRDQTQFNCPHELDISRSVQRHFAFGFGMHYCLGMHLARIEMQVGFQELFKRFPTLRLAIPAEDIELNTEAGLYGLHRLPIAW